MLGVSGTVNKEKNKRALKIFQRGFIEVCLTILYSEDALEVKRAYDRLFTIYKQLIISGTSFVQLSCFEDVVYKILDDEFHLEENEFYHGEKYPAFVKLMAIAKMQKQTSIAAKVYNYVAYGTDLPTWNFPLANLEGVIMSYIYKKSSEDEKNDALKFFLNKCNSVLKVEK